MHLRMTPLASLLSLADRTVAAFGVALKAAGITCPFYITQNDGTLMDASFAEKFPVLTFASGPTNSMRGAAFLSGVKDAIAFHDPKGTLVEVYAEYEFAPDDGSEQGISPLKFGHVAYRVDDVYAACQRLMDAGVTINRPPRDGHMAVVRSPDNISVEILQRGVSVDGTVWSDSLVIEQQITAFI